MLTRFFITAWFIRTFRHRFVQKLRTPLEHPEAHMLFIKKKKKKQQQQMIVSRLKLLQKQ